MNEETCVSLNEIKINKIVPYPKRKIADPSICNKITKLWSYDKKFLILSGPPGVGKTRSAEDYIFSLSTEKNQHGDINFSKISTLFPEFRTHIYTEAEIESELKKRNIKFVWDLVVLHPQYSYEDLIRGYKVFSKSQGTTLEVREGLLGFISRVVKQLQALYPENEFEPKGVLILDEINRAPIGQLFGEAIYALDRRGEKTTTPYELTGFGCAVEIPTDLLILGTMNSIDRATSGFDYALRRRFSNIEIKANSRVVQQVWNSTDPSIKSIGSKLYDLVNDLILSSEATGTIPASELIIGQAYFIPPKHYTKDPSKTIEWLAYSYLYQICPTIHDYCEQGLLEIAPAKLYSLPFGDIIFDSKETRDVDQETVTEDFLRFFNATL